MSFGSLEQRLAAQKQRDDQVRHVWLDGRVAALAIDQRKIDGQWEGLLVHIRDRQPITEWIPAARIRRA